MNVVIDSLAFLALKFYERFFCHNFDDFKPMGRIELPTSNLPSWRSATELHRQDSLYAVGGEGLEPPKSERTPRLQRGAIATMRTTQRSHFSIKLLFFNRFAVFFSPLRDFFVVTGEQNLGHSPFYPFFTFKDFWPGVLRILYKSFCLGNSFC